MFEGKEFGHEGDDHLRQKRSCPKDGESLDTERQHRGVNTGRRVDNEAEQSSSYTAAATWAANREVEDAGLASREGKPTATPAPALDTPTLFDRLVAAGLSQKHAEWHLGTGRVELDGQIVTDPCRPAPRGTRVVIDVP
jgi:hypothetical protein